MSPLQRLLAEEWPDGSFGGPRPAVTVTCQWCRQPIPADTATYWDDLPQCPNPHRCPPRAAEQAQHYADLAAAVYRTHRTRKATT
ncbi:hypothetical protein ACWGDE_01560 [Streptomyces sp. NPDC054956]